MDIWWGTSGYHPENAHAAAYLEAVHHELIEPCSCGGWRFTPKGIAFAPDDFAQPVPPRDRCNVCWPLDEND
jgi:hypothetical protein